MEKVVALGNKDCYRMEVFVAIGRFTNDRDVQPLAIRYHATKRYVPLSVRRQTSLPYMASRASRNQITSSLSVLQQPQHLTSSGHVRLSFG